MPSTPTPAEGAPAATGLQPTLAELIALRGASRHRAPPGRGRLGLVGQSPSSLRGRGMEYAESREYVPGDDARHIDWRLTARSGRAHTKLFQAERERLSLIVADTAPTLYFGTRTRFKSVQAARAAAVAAWLAQRQGDRIAALRGSLREAPVAPAGGARGVLGCIGKRAGTVPEPRRDDDGGRGTAAACLGDRLRHGRWRHRNDHDIGCLRDVRERFNGRYAFNLAVIRVDHMNGSGKAAGDEISDNVAANRIFVRTCADDCERAR